MEWLDSVPTTAVTAVSLVVLMYVAQLRGWIYVGSHVRQMRTDYERRIAEVRQDRDARLADKDREIADWRQAYMNAEVGRMTASEQVRRLVDGVETTVQVVRAIPEVGGPGHAE